MCHHTTGFAIGMKEKVLEMSGFPRLDWSSDKMLKLKSDICGSDLRQILLNHALMKNNSMKLADILNSSDRTDKILENVSSETLMTAGKMYIYLNFCPKNLQDWPTFYKELLRSSTETLLVTLNKLTQTSHPIQHLQIELFKYTLKMTKRMIFAFAFQETTFPIDFLTSSPANKVSKTS